jgi:hypothetical protein
MTKAACVVSFYVFGPLKATDARKIAIERTQFVHNGGAGKTGCMCSRIWSVVRRLSQCGRICKSLDNQLWLRLYWKLRYWQYAWSNIGPWEQVRLLPASYWWKISRSPPPRITGCIGEGGDGGNCFELPQSFVPCISVRIIASTPAELKRLAAGQGHNLKINVQRVVLEHSQVMLEDATLNCVNLEESQLQFRCHLSPPHQWCPRHHAGIRIRLEGSNEEIFRGLWECSGWFASPAGMWCVASM